MNDVRRRVTSGAGALAVLATRALLFDAGNTLLELDYGWLAGMCRSLGADTATSDDVAMASARLMRHNSWRYGRAPAPPDASSVFRGSFHAVGRAVGLASSAAGEFARAAESEDRSDPRGLWRCPAPGAATTLAALSGTGLQLGVISNSDGQVERHLTLAGMRAWFDVVIDSSVVGVEKPDARIFEVTLKQLQMSPKAATYVGDLFDIDVLGARSAGLRALLYDPWDAYPEVREGRIRSLAQLLDLNGSVEQLGGDAR